MRPHLLQRGGEGGEGYAERYERRQYAEGFDGGERFAPHSRYKTALCNNWKRFGNCRHGEACTFAHGEAELRRTHSYGYGGRWVQRIWCSSC